MLCRYCFVFTLLFCLPVVSLSQPTLFTQNIRGVVRDVQTHEPIAGAVVQVTTLTPPRVATSDAQGKFLLAAIPVGRHSVQVAHLGYNAWEAYALLLTSGKELYLTIPLEESVTELEGVTIAYTKRKDVADNEFALASARAFTLAETERYAGSLGDPARMVANYAGVMSVSDERNDIVIRGNSPTGLLWRLEGVDIPSPNHFSTDGLTGGPISMISANYLAQSDFLTGAFPAGYGNALAGAFDLQLRNGNPERYEFVGQIGWGGFELGAEGPFSRRHAGSFLVGYRYSFPALLSRLGLKINLGTNGAIPYYQDLTFKIQVPLSTRWHAELFGLGGLNSIFFQWHEGDTPQAGQPENSVLDFSTASGVLGAKLTHRFSSDARLALKLAATTNQAATDIDSITGPDSRVQWYAMRLRKYAPALALDYQQRLSAQHFWEMGASCQWAKLALQDSVLQSSGSYLRRVGSEGEYLLSQAHLAWRYRPTSRLTLVTGLHGLWLHLNNTWALEPRLAWQWKATARQSFTLSGGLHSQTQSPLYYFLKPRTVADASMRNLGLSRALHGVLAYDLRLSQDLRLKTELYYQWLYQIPVSRAHIPGFSLLDAGDSYNITVPRDLENSGNGRNYGLELTLEKFLSRGYYFLFTSSLFQSQVRTTDGQWRNAKFNGEYAFNLLGGYEFTFSPKFSLLADARVVYAGGKWMNPVDEAASRRVRELVEDWHAPYSEKAAPYFKVNLRLAFRHNAQRFSQEWALDLQNLTNQRNVFAKYWDAKLERVGYRYQQGFFPMVNYRVLF